MVKVLGDAVLGRAPCQPAKNASNTGASTSGSTAWV
jgi:hypothetical protein